MVKFDVETVSAMPMHKRKGLFHAQAAYRVTGGLNGFGLATAKWIVKMGGKHLILISRQGAATDQAKAAVSKLEQQGVTVKTATVDVGDMVQLQTALDNLLKDSPPLKGVFHSAMVLDDALIGQLDVERLRAVMHPKMAGCWNLHQLTEGIDLDYFVLYSSISSQIGNPGQANYAAANAFLDAFSYYRRARGLHALTINWGAISDAGVLSRQTALASHLENSGITPLPSEQALQVLEHLLTKPGGQYGIMQVDWSKLFSALPSLKQEAKFSSLRVAQTEAGHSDFTHYLLNLDGETQLGVLIKFIGERVAHTLKMDASKIDAEVKLNTLGMDSLMAMELQHMMEQKLCCKIPTMELMKGACRSKSSPAASKSC